MGKTHENLVHLAQAMTIEVRYVFYGGHFEGRWQGPCPHHRLIYILEESSPPSRISDTQQTFVMTPGHWLFIPAGHPVKHEQYEKLDLVSIHFDLLYYADPGIFSPGPELYQGVAPEAMADFQALVQQEQPGLTGGLKLQKLLCGFLLPILEEKGDGPARSLQDLQLFQPLLDRFQQDPRRDYSVDEMAGLMKMGRETFVKKFKACLHSPPKKFFNRLRAAHAACRLTADADAPIREIAEEFGFANEFYFSRFIRQHLGMSPRAWRRNQNLRT